MEYPVSRFGEDKGGSTVFSQSGGDKSSVQYDGEPNPVPVEPELAKRRRAELIKRLAPRLIYLVGLLLIAIGMMCPIGVGLSSVGFLDVSGSNTTALVIGPAGSCYYPNTTNNSSLHKPPKPTCQKFHLWPEYYYPRDQFPEHTPLFALPSAPIPLTTICIGLGWLEACFFFALLFPHRRNTQNAKDRCLDVASGVNADHELVHHSALLVFLDEK